MTKIERLRNAASQCRCRPLLRSICTVYFFDCVKLFEEKILIAFVTIGINITVVHLN